MFINSQNSISSSMNNGSSSFSAVSLWLSVSLPSPHSLVFSTQMTSVVITVMFCLHLQFHRGTLTAEQDFDTPLALMLHSLSLKQTLGQGQSRRGRVSCNSWPCDFKFGLKWYFNYKPIFYAGKVSGACMLFFSNVTGALAVRGFSALLKSGCILS